MNTLCIVVLDPSIEEFQELKQSLEAFFITNYRDTFKFKFIHTKDYKNCVAAINQYRDRLALVCVNPSIASSLNVLHQIRARLEELISLDTKILYTGDEASVEEAKQIFQQGDAVSHLINKQSEDYLQQILSKMDEVVSRRASGSQSLNVSVVRLEEKFRWIESSLTTMHLKITGQMDELVKQVDRIDHTLFTSGDLTKTPSIVEMMRSMQRSISSIEKEMGGILNQVQRLHTEDSSIKRRVGDLEAYKKEIQNRLRQIGTIGAKPAQQLMGGLAGLVIVLIANAVGLGEWIGEIFKMIGGG